jgi:hypothetical protein
MLTVVSKLVVSLSVMSHLLVLRNVCKHPARETKFLGNSCHERITNQAIRQQPLFQWERWIGSIWNFPETMPTGTGNDWSGRRQSTAQDDPLIPSQAKRGLNQMI